MSIAVRPAQARGHANHGWLDSRHTFSFAEYHDAGRMGFGPLRVINEDRVQPGAGFGAHGHRNMEIISYVIAGAIEHKDSMGSGSIIRPGDVQVMSAGTGARHSEFNASRVEPVHFLQIWLLPDEQDAPPRYDQRTFPEAERRGRLRLVASRDGREGALSLRQDADIYATLLDRHESAELSLRPGRRAWVQIVTGAADIDGIAAAAGDGVAIEGESALRLVSREKGTQALVFDLP
jgi:quercetin 2,3-dioxygenase